MARVRVSFEAAAVREARPHHPHLPAGDRIHHRVAALANGIAEQSNASIDRIRTNARVFHNPEALITMTMLDRAGLSPDLPWNTAA